MLVDGRASDCVDAKDRGLAYGDGVFETIRFIDRTPVLMDHHLARLMRGCKVLGINAGQLPAQLSSDLATLQPDMPGDCVVKIIVTRGSGMRGYGPRADTAPRRIVSYADYQPDRNASRRGIRVSLCQTRLGINPALCGIKHLNRLEQVLGAAEIREGCDEGIMQDIEGNVIAGTRSNIFAVTGGRLVTPSLNRCGVEGTMRSLIAGLTGVSIEPLSLPDLLKAGEIFVCNSVFGIYPVIAVVTDNDTFRFEAGERTQSLQASIRDEHGMGQL